MQVRIGKYQYVFYRSGKTLEIKQIYYPYEGWGNNTALAIVVNDDNRIEYYRSRENYNGTGIDILMDFVSTSFADKLRTLADKYTFTNDDLENFKILEKLFDELKSAVEEISAEAEETTTS